MRQRVRVMAASGLIFAIALTGWLMTARPKDSHSLLIANVSFQIELASDTTAKNQGLSGRSKLPANRGLLLEFDENDYHGIWMKDMRFPIDIIWLDKDKRVVDMVEAAQPDSYPQVFKPDQPAHYVLEVNAGMAERHGIEIGQQAEF